MCTPHQWDLRATLQYEVLKQRMGAASAPSHRYWCGAAGGSENSQQIDTKMPFCSLNPFGPYKVEGTLDRHHTPFTAANHKTRR